MDFQKIILVGNTTGEIQVQKPEGKTAYADFSVGVSRNRQEKLTDFFPVRAFGKVAEGITQLKKGTKVLVEGRVEIDRFTPEEGEPRKVIRVLANIVLAV